MQRAFLRLLEDRDVGRPFDAEVFSERESAASPDGVEIVSGVLRAPESPRWYPVIDGVPVFVPNAVRFYPEFFAEYKDRLPPPCFTEEEIRAYDGVQLRVQEGFAYEWTRFTRPLGEHDREPFLHVGLRIPEDFNGTTFFEGGCGYGRHAHSILEHGGAQGATAVLCDISPAIWSAKKNLGHRGDVHFLQADLTRLPLRAGAFDMAYALGVLQHTPDPHFTFMQLSSLVREGGRLETGVYEIKHPWGHALERLLRAATTRLPHSWLWALSYLAVIPNFCFYGLGFRHAPGLNPAIRALIRTNPSWKCSQVDTYDWYMAPYQRRYPAGVSESWFVEAGYEELRRDPAGLSCVLGRKKTGAPDTRMIAPQPVPKAYDGKTLL